jgi:hypothetical protein
VNSRPHAIPALAAAALLVIALGEHPYGYYTFLRWSVTIAALVVAWVAWHSPAQIATWLFIGIAVLFNPIAPVYLTRETWRAIDVATAVCFLASLGVKRRPEAAPT